MTEIAAWIFAIITWAVAIVGAWRLVTDYRRWKRTQAQWEQRIQENWMRLIEAARRECDDH